MDNGYRNGVSDLNTKRHIDILLEFSGKTVIENVIINSSNVFCFDTYLNKEKPRYLKMATEDMIPDLVLIFLLQRYITGMIITEKMLCSAYIRVPIYSWYLY